MFSNNNENTFKLELFDYVKNNLELKLDCKSKNLPRFCNLKSFYIKQSDYILYIKEINRFNKTLLFEMFDMISKKIIFEQKIKEKQDFHTLAENIQTQLVTILKTRKEHCETLLRLIDTLNN